MSMPKINETATVTVANQEEAMNLFGKSDEHVKFIEKETGVHVSHRSGVLTITGAGAAGIGEMIENLLEQVRKGMQVEKSDIRYSLMLLQEEGSDKKVEADIKLTNGLGRPIRPRSPKQREYLNAVCRFETTLSPFELLDALEMIEKALGKRPKPKEAPRVIDLDLIFYGDCQINSPKLTVPHPRWNQRLFVLAPLAELTGMKSMPNTFGHEKVTPLTRKFCI